MPRGTPAMPRSCRSEKARQRGFIIPKGPYEESRKSLQKATERQFVMSKKIWDEFLSQHPGINEAEELSELQLPSTSLVKIFLEWRVSSSDGMLSELPSQSSIEMTWRRLSLCLERTTKKTFTKAEQTDILYWIRGSLKTKYGLTVKTREKYYTQEEDKEILLRQLYCYDMTEISDYKRIILSFCLHLAFKTGLRPGTFLPDYYYTDAYIRYMDCKLLLSGGSQNMPPSFVLILTFTNMKNRRGSGKKLEFALIEGKALLDCPVLPFLLLAERRKAFRDFTCIEDLFKLEYPAPRTFKEIYWKSDILSKPVLASSQGFPFKYVPYKSLLAELSIRAGYTVPLIPYDIRRGVANRLNEAGVSKSQQNQVLGHTSTTTYEKYYQSNLNAINLQSSTEDLGDEFQKLIADLRRPPRIISPPTPKMREKEMNSRVPDSVENLGDLRLHHTKVATFYRIDSARRRLKEAVDEPYNIRECSTLIEALRQMMTTPSAKRSFPNLSVDHCCRCLKSFCDYASHVRDHLSKIDDFCGRIAFISTLHEKIASIPGRCPFCLGDMQMKEFYHRREFSDHLDSHFFLVDPEHARKCPHPNCQARDCGLFFENETLLRHHFAEHHGIQEALGPSKISARQLVQESVKKSRAEIRYGRIQS